MIRFLSVSPVVPSTKNAHAGGRVFYYYASKICLERTIDYNLLVFCRKKDVPLYDLNARKIKFVYTSGTIVSSFLHFFYDCFIGRKLSSIHFSLFKQKQLIKYLKKMKKHHSLPDVIQLEWTEMVFFAPAIKRLFPSIRIIASEHDVSFLGAERKASHCSTNSVLKKRYILLKKTELESLFSCDIVMPHNEKDKKLLLENNIPGNKIFVLTPFFHNMLDVVRENVSHDVLFWGAMNRKENYEAAAWFIANVMPLLSNENVRFIVAGNNPHKSLLSFQSRRVLITGYVDDETLLFKNSLCFVAPLLNGAGIKIKVLEALSSGIPVLTNDIGIEGIGAVDKESFFLCKTPEDYASIIKKLLSNSLDVKKMEFRQKEYIKENFEFENAFRRYLTMVGAISHEK